jgi:hypothetical protein
VQELRLAIRTLRATPVVTLVAILSLALGIGANTLTGFSSWTNPLWEQIRDRHELFQTALAFHRPGVSTWRWEGRPTSSMDSG